MITERLGGLPGGRFGVWGDLSTDGCEEWRLTSSRAACNLRGKWLSSGSKAGWLKVRRDGDVIREVRTSQERRDTRSAFFTGLYCVYVLIFKYPKAIWLWEPAAWSSDWQALSWLINWKGGEQGFHSPWGDGCSQYFSTRKRGGELETSSELYPGSKLSHDDFPLRLKCAVRLCREAWWLPRRHPGRWWFGACYWCVTAEVLWNLRDRLVELNFLHGVGCWCFSASCVINFSELYS